MKENKVKSHLHHTLQHCNLLILALKQFFVNFFVVLNRLLIVLCAAVV